MNDFTYQMLVFGIICVTTYLWAWAQTPKGQDWLIRLCRPIYHALRRLGMME